MGISERLHVVATLSYLPRIGRARLKTILGQLDETRPIEVSEVIERFRAEFFVDLTEANLDTARHRAEQMLSECQALGVTVHPFGSASYPPQLIRLKEPPALLFSRGRFDFGRKPRVAVIGTRKPTEWGLITAAACAQEIVQGDGIVVSGLALGIDAAAHAASVDSGGRTWAVLAHGLHTVSPSSNRDLAKRILDRDGALVSEYAPGESAQRHYFVERDRIQAGLSDAVLVIESGIDGGAMHTVRFACEANIPVWVTFPHARVADAEVSAADLPESQQGTWQLLATQKASRVATAKGLSRMLNDLASLPTAPKTLFAS